MPRLTGSDLVEPDLTESDLVGCIVQNRPLASVLRNAGVTGVAGVLGGGAGQSPLFWEHSGPV